MALSVGDQQGFALATAAQRFVLAVLPPRYPESEDELRAFVDAARGCTAHPALVHSVLLQVLCGITSGAPSRLPSLAARYLALGSGAASAVTRFKQVVEEWLRYEGIRSAAIRQVVGIVQRRYTNDTLSLSAVAEELARNPEALARLFKRVTTLRFNEYLRMVRLEQAALLLVNTDKRIKEIWAGVGYRDGATFDHDFQKRFAASPTSYRLAQRMPAPAFAGPAASDRPVVPDVVTIGATVLVVDDDECTRETLARCLRQEGYTVDVASSVAETLRVVARARPRVVLLDYHLPDGDGVTCLRELRRLGLGQPAVALVTADWDLGDSEVDLHALGATLVAKPIFAAEAHRLVETLISAARA